MICTDTTIKEIVSTGQGPDFEIVSTDPNDPSWLSPDATEHQLAEYAERVARKYGFKRVTVELVRRATYHAET
jgi:hypothetical protein